MVVASVCSIKAASLRKSSTINWFPPSTFIKRFSSPSLAMEREGEGTENKKVHVHYDHTLPSKSARWTARESFQFMCNRPWQEVRDFYSNLVNGRSSLSELFGTETPLLHDDTKALEDCEPFESESSLAEDRSGRWERKTFKLCVSYHGGAFDGWQKQPGLNTVQGRYGEAFDQEEEEAYLHMTLSSVFVSAERETGGI